MERTAHGQDGGEISGLLEDTLVGNDPDPQSDQLAMGGEEGLEGKDGPRQVLITEEQRPTDHVIVPDETSEEHSQDVHRSSEEVVPEEMRGEDATEGLGGSSCEGLQPPILPAEDTPAKDSNTSANDFEKLPENLQPVSNEEQTENQSMKAEEVSPATTAPLDAGNTDGSGLKGAGSEESRVASLDATKEEDDKEGDDDDDDEGPSVSAPLSPVDSDTEHVPLPLQQDAPSTPVSGMEVVSMATQLLERWQDLKEVFRIPKKKPNPSGHQEEQVPAAISVSLGGSVAILLLNLQTDCLLKQNPLWSLDCDVCMYGELYTCSCLLAL